MCYREPRSVDFVKKEINVRKHVLPSNKLRETSDSKIATKSSSAHESLVSASIKEFLVRFQTFPSFLFSKFENSSGTRLSCSTRHVEGDEISNKSAVNPDRSRWQRKLAFSRSGAETSSSFAAAEKRPQRRRHVRSEAHHGVTGEVAATACP